MLSALACLAGVALQGPIARGVWLPEATKGIRRAVVYVPDERLDPPKVSPKQKWMFDWLSEGLVRPKPSDEALQPRFRVFSQEHKLFDDLAPVVTRMALRLWEYNFYHLGIDHANKYNAHIVDFYLCFGGTAGGEQLFGEDDEGGHTHSVNTIYIYDLSSFSSPVEMAREVAHEYGHATLAPVGGYTDPEDWANGYLGEKLYLRWIRDEMAAKRLTSDDAMGASYDAINAWVKKNVDPWVVQSATRPPTVNIARTDAAGMHAFLGLALYLGAILPEDVFSRSLMTIGSTSATDYPSAAVGAVETHAEVSLNIPPLLKGEQLFVPVGKGRISGARVLSTTDGWAKIQPLAGEKVKILNPTAP